jgi:dihydrofolate reductase
MIRAILACDEDWGIGKAGTLPWPHNPADLKWFKENTLNSTIVMGRNTWESLPFKPLPKRHNVVVSNTMREQTDIEVVRPDIYRSRCVTINMTDNVWIIGGAQLINNSLDIIDEIWLSRISGTFECDTFLPRELIETTFNLFSSEREGDVYVDKWRAY